MDEDAYHTLSRYYDDIRSRLYEEERQEVMDDVEARTADIFRDNLSYPAQVVSIDMVRVAIATIGSADSFGEKRYDIPSEQDREAEQERAPRKLYRSRVNNMLAGVCGGLADYFGIDVTILRIVAVICAFLSVGTFAIVYIILWIVIPIRPLESRIFDRSTYRYKRK